MPPAPSGERTSYRPRRVRDTRPTARSFTQELAVGTSARQHLPAVADPPRDLLGVQVLEKRNREAAGQPENLLELPDVEASPPRGPQAGDDVLDALLCDEPSAGQADERAPLDQIPDESVHHLRTMPDDLGDFPRRGGLQGPFAEHLRDPLGELAFVADQVVAPGRTRLLADRDEGAPFGQSRLDRLRPWRIGLREQTREQRAPRHPESAALRADVRGDLRARLRRELFEHHVGDVPI